jgi:hypothetical protein
MKEAAKPLPQYIGPHNGRELTLMLAGKKPLAKFVREINAPPYALGDEEFEPHVKSGKLLKFVVCEDDLEFRYYCLPSEEWRVKLAELFRRSPPNNFSEDDLHRLDGALLGYAKPDVERFIRRLRSSRSSSG